MKAKIVANTKIQGKLSRFDEMVNDGKISFILYSIETKDVLCSTSDYNIKDANIEQGRRAVIEVIFEVDTDESISNIDYVCVMDNNPYVSIIEDKIKEVIVISE